MKINNTSIQTSRMKNKQAITNPGFTGKSTQFVKDLVEPQRFGNMGRWLFLVTAFVFLLGGRILGSRDKNEKRETITRDVPTIIIIAGAVPIIEKFLSKHIQKHTGFAILGNKNEKETEDTYAAIKAGTKNADAAKDLPKELISYAQQKNWFVFDENLASGPKGFLERLLNLGGDPKKVCSKLSENIEKALEKFNKNGQEFIDEIHKPENSTLLKEIMDAFKDPKNNALKHAEFLKAIPKLISMAGTLALLGIFIPLFNIAVTEKVNKKEESETKKA